MARLVDVLVPVALDQAYSYRVPDGMALAAGDIVCVPLGARLATGVVWAENAAPNPRLDNRLKYVEERLDIPPLKGELRQFVDWASNYSLSARGSGCSPCCRMASRAEKAKRRPKPGSRPVSLMDWSTRERSRRWCCRPSRWRAHPIPII